MVIVLALSKDVRLLQSKRHGQNVHFDLASGTLQNNQRVDTADVFTRIENLFEYLSARSIFIQRIVACFRFCKTRWKNTAVDMMLMEGLL